MVMKHKLTLLALVCMALLIAGCAVPFRGGPSKDELEGADYGPPAY